jgi:hypothetical protein
MSDIPADQSRWSVSKDLCRIKCLFLINANEWLERSDLGAFSSVFLLSFNQLISMEQGSSSAGGSGRHGSYDQVPVIATIDDAVSLIRSIESAPDDTSTAANNLVPVQIQQVLLPALKRQFHHHKGKGQRLFTHALQGNIDPLSMLDPARNTLGFAYIL